MDDIFLFRYFTDLPALDEAGWAQPACVAAHMQARVLATTALWRRGNVMESGVGFAGIVMCAYARGWRAPLADAVFCGLVLIAPIRVDDASALTLAAALKPALDENHCHDAGRIAELIAFCDRGGFDVV